MGNLINLDDRRKKQAEYMTEMENNLIEALARYICEKDESQGLNYELIYELIKDKTVDDLILMFEEINDDNISWQLFKSFYDLPEEIKYKIFWSVKANIILSMTDPEFDY